MKKMIALIIIFVLSITLISCENNDNKKQSLYFASMYTNISVELYSSDQDILDEIKDIFELYNQISTKYRRNEVKSDSPYYNYENLYTINENAGKKAVEVVDELIDLIEYGILLHQQTNGYFHIGIGNLVDIWKEAIEQNISIPENKYNNLLAEAEAFGLLEIEKIVIDKENKTVYLKDNTIQLDLGALSKGFALNKVVELINDKGIEKYKIDAGSSSMAYGRHPDNRAYRIGIKDAGKKYENGIIGILEAENTSMATSGSSEQWLNVLDENGKIIKDKMVHHIISPFTFKPENFYQSVTLIGEDAGLLDAFSTAVYLMEPEEAITFLKDYDIDYILYLFDYTVVTNISSDEFEKSKLL